MYMQRNKKLRCSSWWYSSYS